MALGTRIPFQPGCPNAAPQPEGEPCLALVNIRSEVPESSSGVVDPEPTPRHRSQCGYADQA
jgi:hypothetical protein